MKCYYCNTIDPECGMVNDGKCSDCANAKRNEYNKRARYRRMIQSVLESQGRKKTNRRNSEQLVGYDAQTLIDHMDYLGMEWGVDDIDHKVPVSWFKKGTPINIINDLRNLRPLKPNKNRSKGNREVGCDVSDEYRDEIKQYVEKDFKSLL